MKIKKTILNKISGLVILFANSATVLGCTFLFNELDVPESLRNQHEFNK